MSAYVLSIAHFAALAAFAVSDQHQSHAINEWRVSANPMRTARKIAEELAKENIRSVSHRYSVYKEERLVVSEAGDLAETYYFNPGKLSALDILRMCECYEYQSCETPDWTSTLAYRQIQWIKTAAMSRLPGWDEAVRDYNGEKHSDNIGTKRKEG
jgi:hypothetical protein